MLITNHIQEAVEEARKVVDRYLGGKYFEGSICPYALAHWLGYILIHTEEELSSCGVEYRLHDYGYAGDRIIEYNKDLVDNDLYMATCIGHIWLGHLKNLDDPIVDIYPWGSVFSPLEVEVASAFGREVMEIYYD